MHAYSGSPTKVMTMARFKVIEHKSAIEEIVNPIAPYARELRDRGLMLDTETSGSRSDDEVIELAIVRPADGHVVFDGMFKPSKEIDPFAYRVHGISNADLRNKPRIADTWDTLYPVFDGATCLAWNAPYDSRLLGQTFAGTDCRSRTLSGSA